MLVIGFFFSSEISFWFFLISSISLLKVFIFSFVLSTFLIIVAFLCYLPEPLSDNLNISDISALKYVEYVFFFQAEIFLVSCMMNYFLLKNWHLEYCVMWVWIFFKYSVFGCLFRHCSTSGRVTVASILPGENESQRSPLTLCCQPMGRVFSLLLDEDESFNSPLNLLWQDLCRKVGRWIFITSEHGSLCYQLAFAGGAIVFTEVISWSIVIII